MNDPLAGELTKAWASVQGIEDRQKASKQKIQKLTDLYAELSQKYESLEGSTSEQAIRNRFLSCAKQAVLHNPTEKDYQFIHASNAVAHHGNCLRDCHLYEAGGRTDFGSFEQIYGFPPSVVRSEISRKFLLVDL